MRCGALVDRYTESDLGRAVALFGRKRADGMRDFVMICRVGREFSRKYVSIVFLEKIVQGFSSLPQNIKDLK